MARFSCSACVTVLRHLGFLDDGLAASAALRAFPSARPVVHSHKRHPHPPSLPVVSRPASRQKESMAMTMEEERAASEALCMMLGGSFENWWCFRPDEEDQCTAGAGWTIPRFCRLSKKNQFARCFHCVKRERAAYISDVDVLFQPCDLYLDGVCHPFSDDLKFTVAPSWLGSLDVDITGGGGHTIRVPEYLSAQHPLVQMLLFAGVVNASRFREDVLFSCPQSFVPKCVRSMVKISRSPTNREGEDGVNPDTGAVTVQERISKENNMDNRRGRLSSAGRQLAGKQVPIAALQGHTGRMPWIADQQGQAASEPDRTTDWEQQQQQQQGSTLNGVNHVAEPELGSPSAGFSIAGDQVWLPACDQGEMEKAATTLGGDISANSGSAASEATCKTSGGLALAAAAEYPNDQHFLKDDAELGGQQRGDGAHDESENLSAKFACAVLSGKEPRVTAVHGISTTSPFMTANPGTTTWLMASGALHHATGNRELLCDFFAQEHGDLFVKTGDAGAAPMSVLGRGSVVTDTVVLHDVWYVPGLAVNVVSVSQLAVLDYSVTFGGGKCYVRNADDGAVVGAARPGEDGLFALDFIRVPPGFL